MKIVLDAFALMVFLQREPQYAVMRQMLKETADGQHDAHISIINLGEVFYMRYRKGSPEKAEAALRFVRRINLQIEPATPERVMRAARLKATVRLSYADAFAATLAQELGATLVTGDPEFKPLASTINIMWL